MANTTCERHATKVLPRGSLPYESIPIWMQVDPCIRRGYRAELKTSRACMLSLFYVHNESVNIWSHFAPALVHLFLLVQGARGAWEDNGREISAMDTAMVQLYILSAIICLLSSVSVSTAAHLRDGD
jgi:adiponectin receptor